MDRAGIKAIVEMFLEVETSKQQSFEDAVHATKAQLPYLQNPELAVEIFDEIIEKLEEQRNLSTLLIDISTSHHKDLLAKGWYIRVPLPGGLWESLRKRMEASGLADAVGDIDKSTDEILSFCAQPLVKKDKRLGLVIGNVQSGKTANYASVIAKALDRKYKMVIVLSGIHNNLRKQTQKRLERDLGVAENPKDWFLLTQADADMGKTSNAAALLHGNSYVLAVVKKNKGRLENLRAFLRDLDPHQRENTPILIIDDESDQATPDASSGSDSDPTTISRLMSEIWAEVENGTYIGYTATPFANIFTSPEPAVAGGLEPLYPRHFVHAMPTPSNYFGAEKIFGLSHEVNEEVDPEVPDVIRWIHDEELESLAPKSSKDVDEFVADVPPTLSNAIRWFIIATAVRYARGQHDKHSSMLVHTTHRVDPHFEMRDAIEQFLEPLRKQARSGFVDDFYDLFDQEYDRAAELYSGAGDSITWPEIKNQIPNVLRRLKVLVDNGKAHDTERLDYSGDKPQTVIVIGGGTLSRGLTLEGLFVSYFTRTSNTYDTLLQMGRWFGYRDQYEDLQRIWLSKGLAADYSFLASVEFELRRDIKRMIGNGETPAEIGVRVLYHPGRLQITSPNKMRLIKEVQVIYEGCRVQTYKFDVANHATSNRVATEKLLTKLQKKTGTPLPQRKGPVQFSGVDFSELQAFFDDYRPHEDHATLYKGSLDWVRTNLPDKKWNVVVASGSVHDEPFQVGDITVSSVRRAPLDFHDGDEDINIRALMTGDDLRIDFRKNLQLHPELARIEDPYQQRQHSQGANGNGLLVIYPISRNSKATSSVRNKVRDDMDTVLNKIRPGLSDEDAGNAIIGIGLVTPFDTEHVVQDKRTYVAVNPTQYFDAEEDVDHDVFDTEKSYDAGKE